MGILGSGGWPSLGSANSALASSVAAGQLRSAALVDRDQADQAIQKLQADQVRLNDSDLDDSIETDFSHGQVADRDSDGRLPWRQSGGDTPQEPPAEEKSPGPRMPPPQDERGSAIDVEV